MQYDAQIPADPAGFMADASAIDSDIHLALRRTSPTTQPSLMSIALDPQVLRSAESRRAIMFQRAHRLGLERFAQFVRRSLDVSAVAISLVEGDSQVALYASGLQEPWASRQRLPLTQALGQYPVTSRDSFIIEDALQHPWLHTNAAMQDTGMRAYAGLPLIAIDGQILGALCVVDQHPRRWQSDQIALLQRTGLQIANALSLDLATQALRILMRQRASVDARDMGLEALGHIFGWDVVSLWQQPPDEEKLGCVAFWRHAEVLGPVGDVYLERFHELKISPGEGLTGLVAQSNRPLWVPDFEREQRAILRSTMLRLQLKSAFLFPATLGTRQVGVIAGMSRASLPHGDELTSVIAVLGGQVGAFLQKMRKQPPTTAY